jgi:hypothetical protein
MPPPKTFDQDPDGFRKFAAQNPNAIIVSESDNKTEHPDIMHKAICHHASGGRQTKGDWTKRVFYQGETPNDVDAWYANNGEPIPQRCKNCSP